MTEEQTDEDIIEDNTALPLGQWVNLPRRSRRAAGQNPVDAFVDVHRAEEGAINTTGVSMLHVATSPVKGNFSRFDEGVENGMLKEAVDVLKQRNEPRYLENFIVGYLLNQISAKRGIKKHGEKAVETLLKEFT